MMEYSNVRTIIFICSVFLSFSCTYNSVEDTDNEKEFRIITGTICGWCTVNDTLVIQGKSVRYVNYTNCSKGKPTIQKTGELKQADIDLLISLLDFDEIRKIELNSCNVCFDGCDDWIRIEKGTDSHYIRFSREESKLKSIQNFVDQLNLIKAQYSTSF